LKSIHFSILQSKIVNLKSKIRSMYNIDEFISDPGKLSALSQAIQNPGSVGFLLSAKIKLTPRCNLRCRMCGFWRLGAQPELDSQRLSAIIAEMGRMGVRKIHFSGGEPLLRPDLTALLEQCRRLKIRANITTNGTLITKETARRLIKCGARGVSVSIDGPNPKTHDGIRGVSGSFKAAAKGIEQLASARENLARNASRMKIRVNTVIQRQNFAALPRIAALAGELGADEMQPMPVDSKHQANRLKKSEIKDFNLCVAPEFKIAREKYGFSADHLIIYPFGQTKQDIQHSVNGDYALGYYRKNLCHAPWLHLFISWDGHVFPCCMTRSRVASLGDVSSTTVSDIFSGERYSILRRKFIQRRYSYCEKCDNFLKENNSLRAALEKLKIINHKSIS